MVVKRKSVKINKNKNKIEEHKKESQDDFLTLYNRYDTLVSIANSFYARNEIDFCIKTCEKAIKLFPNRTHAYYILGLIYEEDGNIEKQLEVSHKIAIIKKDDCELWERCYELSKCLNKKKELYFIKKLMKLKHTRELLEEKHEIIKSLQSNQSKDILVDDLLFVKVQLMEFDGIYNIRSFYSKMSCHRIKKCLKLLSEFLVKKEYSESTVLEILLDLFAYDQNKYFIKIIDHYDLCNTFLRTLQYAISKEKEKIRARKISESKVRPKNKEIDKDINSVKVLSVDKHVPKSKKLLKDSKYGRAKADKKTAESKKQNIDIIEQDDGYIKLFEIDPLFNKICSDIEKVVFHVDLILIYIDLLHVNKRFDQVEKLLTLLMDYGIDNKKKISISLMKKFLNTKNVSFTISQKEKTAILYMNLLIQQGKHKEALSYLHILYNNNRKNENFTFLLNKIYILQGDHENAEKYKPSDSYLNQRVEITHDEIIETRKLYIECMKGWESMDFYKKSDIKIFVNKASKVLQLLFNNKHIFTRKCHSEDKYHKSESEKIDSKPEKRKMTIIHKKFHGLHFSEWFELAKNTSIAHMHLNDYKKAIQLIKIFLTVHIGSKTLKKYKCYFMAIAGLGMKLSLLNDDLNSFTVITKSVSNNFFKITTFFHKFFTLQNSKYFQISQRNVQRHIFRKDFKSKTIEKYFRNESCRKTTGSFINKKNYQYLKGNEKGDLTLSNEKSEKLKLFKENSDSDDEKSGFNEELSDSMFSDSKSLELKRRRKKARTSECETNHKKSEEPELNSENNPSKLCNTYELSYIEEDKNLKKNFGDLKHSIAIYKEANRKICEMYLITFFYRYLHNSTVLYFCEVFNPDNFSINEAIMLAAMLLNHTRCRVAVDVGRIFGKAMTILESVEEKTCRKIEETQMQIDTTQNDMEFIVKKINELQNKKKCGDTDLNEEFVTGKNSMSNDFCRRIFEKNDLKNKLNELRLKKKMLMAEAGMNQSADMIKKKETLDNTNDEINVEKAKHKELGITLGKLIIDLEFWIEERYRSWYNIGRGYHNISAIAWAEQYYIKALPSKSVGIYAFYNLSIIYDKSKSKEIHQALINAKL